ncbi:pyridoxamine 5'-phosphate oxidase [Flocculibacter collagenilyticus]|uniref:pyridoxamine 5'-phosphate oxidase n=1 Tax=Flocculibacter collagenilyticus TaxID=2744479 RepID=UPI0018F4434C|nr:pyridoxamine 5'-phosphate oxidase [Flocculibacter collagenilyticus]
MKLDDIRRQYSQHGLERDMLADEPVVQFERWLQDAIDAKLSDPTAMTIATVDAQGQPSQRIVLLKNVDENGFVFYTNLESKKASDLAVNNKISLHFPWHFINRQVIVYGEAEPLPASTALKYFLSRPKESQLAAWASAQSRPISSRQALLEKFTEMKNRFKDGDISLPKFWGGYLVKPHKIEFWQGRENRLHDRFIYAKNDQQQWQVQRLNP